MQKKHCITYSCILGAPNTLGNFLFAEKHRLGENLPNIFRYLGVPEYFRQKIHYIFGIFRPRRINHVCDNFRSTSLHVGDRDRGGSNLRTPEEGGENFEFSGVPEFDPFLQRFYRKPLNEGVKSPSFPRATFGASSPPPSSVRYVLTPPIPVSDHGFRSSSAHNAAL